MAFGDFGALLTYSGDEDGVLSRGTPVPVRSKAQDIESPIVLLGNPVIDPTDPERLGFQFTDEANIRRAILRLEVKKALAHGILIDHVKAINPKDILRSGVAIEDAVLTDLRGDLSSVLIKCIKNLDYELDPETVQLIFEGPTRKELWVERDRRSRQGEDWSSLCTSDETSCAVGARVPGTYSKSSQVALCSAVHAFAMHAFARRNEEARTVVTFMQEGKIGSSSGFVRHTRSAVSGITRVFNELHPDKEVRAVVYWYNASGDKEKFDSKK